MTKEVSRGITYIGADDFTAGCFENQYSIPEGMSYNSYLVKGEEKIAVLDTCDPRCEAAWKENIREALKGRTPDYLVVHHAEPDHTALVAWMLGEYPSLEVVASAKAIQMLLQFFPGCSFEGRTRAVGEGDTLDLGGRTLRFISAPMVHWPEVMVSYDSESGVLFSADAFGKFGGLSRCGYFSEEDGDWACEARRYYFNICGKYGLQVQALLRKVSALDVKAICPLHGPILRGDLSQYVDLYKTWSSYAPETVGVFIAHASIHGGTAEAAHRLSEILLSKGCPKVAISSLCTEDQSEAVEDAFRYSVLVMAASSYDAGIFPPAGEFLRHLGDKGWKMRKVALIENGSWAPSAGRVMKEAFSKMKDVEILEPMVTIRSRMTPSDEKAIEALADVIMSNL